VNPLGTTLEGVELSEADASQCTTRSLFCTVGQVIVALVSVVRVALVAIDKVIGVNNGETVKNN
jgi:hypothetical protein